MATTRFEWDDTKQAANLRKHGVDFYTAQDAFEDPARVIARDLQHSDDEPRYYCLGKVGQRVMTVRFTLRRRAIRIIGTGYWRKVRRTYEKANQIHG